MHSEVITPLLSTDECKKQRHAKLNIARTVNAILTTAGMVSIGLLAMLETHDNVNNQRHWSVPAVITMDIIAFFTAIIGKVAIVLHFNEREFLSGFEKILTKTTPDFFKLREKSMLEFTGWAFNVLISINACLFWTGLAQISFLNSSKLLNEFDSSAIKTISTVVKNPFFYLFFLISSFYANMFSWPGIHIGGYYIKKDFFRWLNQHDDYRLLKEDILIRIKTTHQHLLCEMKQAILNNSESFPQLNALYNKLCDSESTSAPLALDTIISTISNTELHKLREAYILLNTTPCHSPDASWLYYLKRFFSTAISILCIYGFRNILGLTNRVWENWGLEPVSKYGAGLFAYYSMIDVVLLTVNTMIDNLLELPKHGIPPHVFSYKKLSFIFSMIFFIGICGGLANAEQSDLDGESTLSVTVADLSSFLVDSFAIYMIMRGYFENTFLKTPPTEDVLKKHFITLRNLGNELNNIHSLKSDDIKLLVESLKNNNTELGQQSAPGYLSLSNGTQRIRFNKQEHRLFTKKSTDLTNSSVEIEFTRTPTPTHSTHHSQE